MGRPRKGSQELLPGSAEQQEQVAEEDDAQPGKELTSKAGSLDAESTRKRA